MSSVSISCRVDLSWKPEMKGYLFDLGGSRPVFLVQRETLRESIAKYLSSEDKTTFNIADSFIVKDISPAGAVDLSARLTELAGSIADPRVGAVSSVKDGKAYLFGYGHYVGDRPCPKLGGQWNPLIILDNGKKVWGCECWWGPEEDVKKEIEPFVVIFVPTPERDEDAVLERSKALADRFSKGMTPDEAQEAYIELKSVVAMYKKVGFPESEVLAKLESLADGIRAILHKAPADVAACEVVSESKEIDTAKLEPVAVDHDGTVKPIEELA